jgi:hypothetical protein
MVAGVSIRCAIDAGEVVTGGGSRTVLALCMNTYWLSPILAYSFGDAKSDNFTNSVVVGGGGRDMSQAYGAIFTVDVMFDLCVSWWVLRLRRVPRNLW